MEIVIWVAVGLLVVWLTGKILSTVGKDAVSLVKLLRDPDALMWTISAIVGVFIVYKVVDRLTGWDYNAVDAYVIIPVTGFAVFSVYCILELALWQARKRIGNR